MFLKDYAPEQYDVFTPQFDDGFVTAAGLSIANGIERAVNMTALYANQYKKFVAERTIKSISELKSSDLAEREINLWELEKQQYADNIAKRKENQKRLEGIIDQIGDMHNLGTPSRLVTQFTSSIIEGLNPVELAVDVLAGGIAGKITKGLSGVGMLSKALSKTSTRMLVETGIEGVLGGSYDGIRNMYVYDQWTPEVFFDGVKNRTMFSVGLYGAGRFLKYRGKIRTPEELNEFRRIISQESVSSASKKVNKRAIRFMQDVIELKKNAGKSNTDGVLDSLDKIIDTHFALGSKISKEDVLEMINIPKHSEAWENASVILSSKANKGKVDTLVVNRVLKSDIMNEIDEIKNSIPDYEKVVVELGEKRLRIEEIQAKKGKLNRKEKSELKKLRKEISETEENLQIKKVIELEKQAKILDDEVVSVREELNSQLTDYDIDTFINEKNQYNEEFLTLNDEKIIEKLQQDVEHSSFKVTEEVVDDPKPRGEEVQLNVETGKAKSDDPKLNLDVEELNEISTDWKERADEKVNLFKQWVVQGCEL